MARTIVNLNESWQQIASAEAAFTIQQVAAKSEILINTAQDDSTAMRINTAKKGKQVQQTAAVITYARATVASGCSILVDDD